MTITEQGSNNPLEAFNYEYFVQLSKISKKDADEYCQRFGGKTGEYDPSVAEAKVQPISIPVPIQIQIDHRRMAGGVYTMTEDEILDVQKQREAYKMNIPKQVQTNESQTSLDNSQNYNQESNNEQESSEVSIEDIRKQYFDTFGKEVSAFKKNNKEWMLSKINEALESKK